MTAFDEIQDYADKTNAAMAPCGNCEKDRSLCEDCQVFVEIDEITDDLIKRSKGWTGKKSAEVGAYFKKLYDNLEVSEKEV